VELAELLQCPVVDQAGRMNFPSRHPLNHSFRRNAVVSQADVIVGIELNDYWGALHSYNDRIVRKGQGRALYKPGRKLVSLGVVGFGLPEPARKACAAEPISFAEDVFPIFKGRCVGCHQPGAEGYDKSGLDLTSYEGLMKGTKFGPMVIPRDPDGSNLMWLLDWRASPQVRMPHGKKKLSTCDRNAIRDWIREGAKNN
jgi:hypothetical protein